ncbi:SRPBCC family protein [Wenzhouxiangella sp. XN79A]|uniref:SRPBCC family protein n=1 Tax=Wenzhouxiangella sp. XN79A TaxID=2724193 RepID=UPI00144AECFD|nr:SRPBCC family protein [Wenzhouxiangella sp. XN79A]NKI34174.1 SRPBCC family protein [Wenzhouxiangella sp. XN79A]
MQTIDITETIALPIDRAFELLADHADYHRFPGITRSELLQEGTPAPNGLGALRRVALGRVVLDEEITGFEPPDRLAYRVIASKPVEVVHEGGVIELTEVPEGTRIRWRSTFELKIPLVGGLVTRRAARQFERGFRKVLRALPEL